MVEMLITEVESFKKQTYPDQGADLDMSKEEKNGKIFDHNGTAVNDSLGRRRSGRF